MEEEESDKFFNVVCVLICIASGASAWPYNGLAFSGQSEAEDQASDGDDQEGQRSKAAACWRTTTCCCAHC